MAWSRQFDKSTAQIILKSEMEFQNYFSYNSFCCKIVNSEPIFKIRVAIKSLLEGLQDSTKFFFKKIKNIVSIRLSYFFLTCPYISPLEICRGLLEGLQD